MKFEYGEIVTPPQGFAPPEAWSEFGSVAYPAPVCKREEVGEHPKGVRWSLWPLTFEDYVSDEEPNMEDSRKGALAYNRVVTWRRIARNDVPAGWKQYTKKPWRIDGFHELQENYLESWDKDTRRNIRTWRNEMLGKRYTIEEISFDEFIAAYKKSSTGKRIGLEQLASVIHKHTIPLARQHMLFLGVRNIESRAIIAGTAVFYVPERNASVRECPFMFPEAREVFAMTGLMDYWFSESLRRGIKYLYFTHFWYKGMPRAWRGFSEFKSHFGLKYVAYPPQLIRFVRGKFL